MDIYSFIVQENFKIADPNISNAVVNGMNLIVNNKQSTLIFVKGGIHVEAPKFVSKK